MNVLAGDIGGTHARLAIVEVGASGARIVREATTPSHDAPALAPLVEAFLRAGTDRPAGACLAVAGPVRDGEARTTNLPWTVRASDLSAAAGVRDTRLINDFEAVGHALPLLGPADVVTLQAGQPVEGGPVAIIGPGTGLGQGFLTWSGGYQVHASEGGHATFAPQREVEWGLFQFLARRFGHVSWERVLSGPGLVSIHAYLTSTTGRTPSTAMQLEMVHDDPAAVISRHGIAGTDPVAVEALDLFVGALGAQAGNLALTVLATGGVFLAGGIAPRMVDRLKTPAFLEPFRRKGRLEHLLAKVPVKVIVNPDAGLLGAASVAAGLRPGTLAKEA